MKRQLIKRGYKGDFVTHKNTRKKLYLSGFEACNYVIAGVSYSLYKIEGNDLYLVHLCDGGDYAMVNCIQ